jgi:hypothetical protein
MVPEAIHLSDRGERRMVLLLCRLALVALLLAMPSIETATDWLVVASGCN